VTGAPRARFVIGTGRCGSTLLSRMLAENPEVLNVFELFSGIDQFFRFRRDPVGGAELAARLREDHPMLTMVMRRGYEVPEVVYPFGAPSARFASREPIPWALGIAIARITDQPDALFDELLAHVEALPTQAPRLLRRCTKSAISRLSAGNGKVSITMAPSLVRMTLAVTCAYISLVKM
jgi:hypothetical protein